MNKALLRRKAERAVRIGETGTYVVNDQIVSIAADVKLAKEKTETIETSLFKTLLSRNYASLEQDTKIYIANDTTLCGTKKLMNLLLEEENEEESQVCVLNFASARHPGGGFLKGAQAQEESLCRNSALFECIRDNRMYSLNEGDSNRLLYQNIAIYTPGCPVFATEDKEVDDEENDESDGLLVNPYKVSFITMAAPNAECLSKGVTLQHLRQTFEIRIYAILAIAAHFGHKNLVLGAFGCGVFGNDLKHCAETFRAALTGRFKNVFENVLFAITADKCDTFHHYFGKRYVTDTI